MKKVAIFAFQGETMCFVHVLINAIEMKEKGIDVKVIIEGAACKLITDLNKSDNPLNKHYKKVVEMGLLDCICKACANKMGTLEEAEKQGLTLNGELLGHPSISKYIEEGYEIITM